MFCLILFSSNQYFCNDVSIRDIGIYLADLIFQIQIIKCQLNISSDVQYLGDKIVRETPSCIYYTTDFSWPLQMDIF